MLELEPGRGITYFRGNPLHRIAHPAREVGVLLGDVPGHPARTARGQLRMLCAAAGVPVARADEMLDVVGLAGLGAQQLGTLSRGMDRRLGLASALLGDPQTLILDEPGKGLARARRAGCTACCASTPHTAEPCSARRATPKRRPASRIMSSPSSGGRLVGDQDAREFSRTRLRPRVAVRTPHTARLAAVVQREARAAQRSVEVVTEAGNRLSVYGSSCAEIGETAFRHGVLVHRLTDEIGDTGLAPPAAGDTEAAAGARPTPPAGGPPPLPRPATSPVQAAALRTARFLGVRTPAVILAVVLLVSLACCILLARSRTMPLPVVLAAWPPFFPLPPAAFGAGLIGALSFGEEFRHPALATARGTVPRRLGLLIAKLTVTATAALLLALVVVVADAQALRVVYGSDVTDLPRNWPALAAGWGGLSVGCAWAGLLAAGVFRVTAAGVAAVLAVPIIIAPLVQKAIIGPSVRSIAGISGRLRELTWVRLPRQADDLVMAGVRVLAQPVGAALVLSLSVLICAYMVTGLRRRAPW